VHRLCVRALPFWLPGGLRWSLLVVRQSASQIVDYTYIKSRAGQQLQFQFQLQLCGAADRYFLSTFLTSARFRFRFFWRSLCVTAILHTKSKRNQKSWHYIQSPSCSLIYSSTDYIVSHVYIVTYIYISVGLSYLLRLYRPACLCAVLFALLLARSIFSGWLSDIALFIVATPRNRMAQSPGV